MTGSSDWMWVDTARPSLNCPSMADSDCHVNCCVGHRTFDDEPLVRFAQVAPTLRVGAIDLKYVSWGVIALLVPIVVLGFFVEAVNVSFTVGRLFFRFLRETSDL